MSKRMKYVNGVVHAINNPSPGNFAFPEMQYPQYRDKPNAGLAFSGGGTRSATLTAGQLRALQATGLLDQFRYISCVSGGSWSAVPFVYLDAGIPDRQFLGDDLGPAQITPAALKRKSKKSLAYAAANARLFDDVLTNLFAGDERYAQILGNIFLKPFAIGSEKRFFSLNADSVAAIIANNPRLTPNDFYTVNPNSYRPYLIAGGTILRPNFGRYHYEMTPLYVGTSSLHPNAGSDGQYPIGGGYVEPHMADSDAPAAVGAGGLARVRLGKKRHMFTLSDVIGTSGSAPAEYADRFGLEVGFPEFKYWSPAGQDRAKEYDFGDGGILENLGIMPLLKRRVERICVFVNSSSNLLEDEVASSIKALFKALPDRHGRADFDSNIVLEDQGKYDTLVAGLKAAAVAGNGAVFTDDYDVLRQDHYGIEGGWRVRITWVVNVRAKNWQDQLPFKVKERLENGDYSPRFPHLKTFFENFPFVIDLGVRQANLMTHLAAWIVRENEAEIRP